MAVALLLCASTMQAKNEKISFQVQAGLNLSQMTGQMAVGEGPEEEEHIKNPVKAGFNLSFRVDYQFNDYLAIQTGLGYSMKGETQKMDYKNEENTIETMKTSIHYLEIPILVGARYSINDDIQLQFNTGPYIAIGLGGKMKYKYTTDRMEHMYVNGKTIEYNPSEEESWKIFGDDFEDGDMDSKRFDAGWKFELGVDIKNYYVGLAYDLGFVDITNSKAKKAAKEFGDNYEPMKNRNFSINVGYRF